uniref:Uncharacterized protein n=1 Tax=Romanomermis culicivorax TaxID=13658 RepID=A0A915KPT6_ROMCU
MVEEITSPGIGPSVVVKSSPMGWSIWNRKATSEAICPIIIRPHNTAVISTLSKDFNNSHIAHKNN